MYKIAGMLCGLTCGIMTLQAQSGLNQFPLPGSEPGKQLDSLVYTYPDNIYPANKYDYTYDKTGQVLRETFYSQNRNAWLAETYTDYQYDAAGNRTAMRQSDREGKPISDTQYTYDAAGHRIHKSRVSYFAGVPHSKTISEYNAAGQETLRELHEANDNGELIPLYRYLYRYDKNGVCTDNETWDWDGSQWQLQSARHFNIDADGRIHCLSEQNRVNNRIEISIDTATYDAEGRQVRLENIVDNASFYKHFIETWSYEADGTGRHDELDSIRYKTENNRLEVTAFSTDCTYDAKGQLLSKSRYVVDSSSEARTDSINHYEYAYDANGKVIKELYIDYEDSDPQPTKDTLTWGDNGISYEKHTYYWDEDTEGWTLHSGEKYDYTAIDSANYSYIQYYLNMETQEWESSFGYKQTRKGDANNFERYAYKWDNEAEDWSFDSGTKYCNEADDEGNVLSYYANWDPETENWVASHGDKREVSGTNPKIYKEYICTGTLEDWALNRTVTAYFSEASLSANESIAAQATMKVYGGNGTLRIESAQAGTLAVYTAAGCCVYVAPTDGTAQISNLASGIYIVRLQTATGAETIKVNVD